MALAGIVINASRVTEFNQKMAQFRAEQNMFAELKWKKVSRGRIEEYKRFIDYFFDLVKSDVAHFHCLLIDTSQVDHARFGATKEIGFYKFYYQLILHCFGGKYCSANPDNHLHVFLDCRTSSYSLDHLKKVLNAGMASRFKVPTAPFKILEPRCSKECDLIQICDILLGAIGYQKNGYDLVSGASPAKIELMKYIINKSGLKNLTTNTPKSKPRLSIWNFRLQK